MKHNLYLIFLFSLLNSTVFGQKIDRKAVIQRHNVQLSEADILASLSLGNGKFCFTADITGLQTFPDEYAKGNSLAKND